VIAKRTSVACRCNRAACQHRRRLPKHPGEYTRPPKCKSCGKGHYRPDPYRTAGKEWRKPCQCGNYHFPHARGRGYCAHNPHLTPEMMQAREESGAWR